jgi:dephospho-CoA kinase
MIVLGLTGSIGMGKSATATMLRRLRIPVHDADAAVHTLYGKGGKGAQMVAALFPQAMADDGSVDRHILGRLVIKEPKKLAALERHIHPLARAEAERFLRQAMRRRCRLVALDIPLLFETGGEQRADIIIVVSAPAFLQRQRVMRRPGMSEEKFHAIRCRQWPDASKRRCADIGLPSGLGKAFTLRRLRVLLSKTACLRRKRRCRRHNPPWRDRGDMQRLQTTQFCAYGLLKKKRSKA